MKKKREEEKIKKKKKNKKDEKKNKKQKKKVRISYLNIHWRKKKRKRNDKKELENLELNNTLTFLLRNDCISIKKSIQSIAMLVDLCLHYVYHT